MPKILAPVSRFTFYLVFFPVVFVSFFLIAHVAKKDSEKRVHYEMDDAALITLFHRFYAEQWSPTYWLNVPIVQNPMDTAILQEIISEIRPDVIIETGTYQGGSSLLFAMLLDQVNPGGKVITVDIDPQVEQASKYPVFKERVTVIKGDSVSPNVLSVIAAEIEPDDVVLVTLDSLHTKEHVLKELRLYSPLVTQGSYLIVQDTNINGHPVRPDHGPGPMEAVEEFMEGNVNFVADRTREKHFLTFYPKGFLKRVY